MFALRADTENPRLSPGGVSVEGRPRHTAYELQGGTWRQAGTDIDPSAEHGTQRPFGFSVVGRPCIAYNRLSGDPAVGPLVDVSCLRRDRWQRGMLPPISAETAAAAQEGAQAEPHVVNADGATAVGDQVHLGVDFFHGDQVDWPVFRSKQGRWEETGLARDSTTWNSQGSLHTVDREAWAVRFDQRQGSTGLRTQLQVRALDEKGRARNVGHPLLRDARFFGPLYWDLAATTRQVYVGATVPMRGRGRNEFRVFVLRR